MKRRTPALRLLTAVPALAAVLAFHAPQVATAESLLGTLFDPVIEILPPQPVPYVAYDGPVCTDGARACIDRTITRMQRRLAADAAACDHDAIFGLAYLRVTQDVRRALDADYYGHEKWLNRLDAYFAHLYFTTMDTWHAGRRTAVPAAWRVALQAADDKTMTGLGNFMLSMNAHINRDFSFALAEVGLRTKGGASFKHDHNAYNPRLDALMDPVFAEEAARFDPAFDDLHATGLDAELAGTIMRGWREMVWRNAEALLQADTPEEKAAARKRIEGYALTQANLIKLLFASGSPAKRDAWCATHHG